MKKQIGIIGLGKMGGNLALHLREKDWSVVGYNRSSDRTEELAQKSGMKAAHSYEELVEGLEKQRLVWLMLPAGDVIDTVLDEITPLLSEGDVVIDGGNSHFKDTERRGKKLAEKSIDYVDVGVSGGPEGARKGACLMVGGSTELFQKFEDLYKDLSVGDGYAHFEGLGTGHYVKMVHNGIEYGMMQAIAEGFNVMKQSGRNIDLKEAARVYNHGSVIESSLIEWLHDAYEDWGQELDQISGEVSHSGEGEWTVEAADEIGAVVKNIHQALQFRKDSQGNPTYVGKIVSALRGKFGGHPVKNSDNNNNE